MFFCFLHQDTGPEVPVRKRWLWTMSTLCRGSFIPMWITTLASCYEHLAFPHPCLQHLGFVDGSINCPVNSWRHGGRIVSAKVMFAMSRTVGWVSQWNEMVSQPKKRWVGMKRTVGLEQTIHCWPPIQLTIHGSHSHSCLPSHICIPHVCWYLKHFSTSSARTISILPYSHSYWITSLSFLTMVH